MEDIVELELELEKGYFFIKVRDQIGAKMIFTLDPENRMTILHTEVGPAFNGKGFGKKMLEKAIDFARERRLKIIPLCPFAKAVIKKTSEYHDVLYIHK
jgi:uncharacterized protein